MSDSSGPPGDAGATRSAAPGASRSAGLPAFSAEFLARFRIVETLGAGAMGVVYRGIQIRLNREVAIKCPQLVGQSAIDRFVAEGAILSQLDHPNIVRVYAAGADEGRPYIIFELVHGQTLAALRKARALALPEVLGLVVQMLEGLGHAHSRKVLHRDVKSENALVTADGTLKVVDFGLARSEERSSGTVQGIPFGTPAYMSPEQARGEPLDARADLYSAGVVLFELLAGRLPFEGASVAEMLAMQIGMMPPGLAAIVPGIPGDLARIVARALAKRKEDRYATARKLIEALEAVQVPGADSPARTTLESAKSVAASQSISGLETVPTSAHTMPTRASGPTSRTVVGARTRTGARPIVRTTQPVRSLPPQQPATWPKLAAVAGVLAIGVLALATLGLGLRRSPVDSPSTASGPASPPNTIQPDVRWAAASVVATWTSSDLVLARLEVLASQTSSVVATSDDTEATDHHEITVGGLQPGTDYVVRGVAAGVLVFALGGHTPSAADQGRAVARSLRRFDPWGLLSKIRRDFGRDRRAEAATPTGREDARTAHWNQELSARLKSTGLRASVAAFKGVRDVFFSSREVPIHEKLDVYGLTQQLRELELVCEAHELKGPHLAKDLASEGYGLLSAPRLKGFKAATIVFRLPSTGTCSLEAALADEGPRIAVGPDPGAHFILTSDRRGEDLQPGRIEEESLGVELTHFYSESTSPLPLPPPLEIEQAELHAIVRGMGTRNRLRVFLGARPGRWTYVADLWRTDASSQRIEHSLDPRVLEAGSRLRVELVYFPEDALVEGGTRRRALDQHACVESLSVRWTSRSGAPPSPQAVNR